MESLPQDHIAHYGQVALPKGYCQGCRRMAFVQDGCYCCCGAVAADFCPTIARRASNPKKARKKPSLKRQDECLKYQHNRCLYCERRFGSLIWRGIGAIALRICWDHFKPWSFDQDNSDSNFVAACQVCNGIKSDLYFDTLEEAQSYILEVQDHKGYRDAP